MKTTLPFTVVGDVHGRLDTLQLAAVQALRAGKTTLIQVGDFWCYDPATLRKADRMLGQLAEQFHVAPEDLRIYFCDGNHEDFNILDPNATEPVHFGNHITYVPRGLAVDIQGVRVGFLGGAESIDANLRTQGKDWWPEERITCAQTERALDMGKLDVLITHDTTMPVFEELSRIRGGDAKVRHVIGKQERLAIGHVLEATNPEWMFHGHHHTWGAFQQYGTTVVALAADGLPGTVVLVEDDAVVPQPTRIQIRDDAEPLLQTEPIYVW